MSLSIVSRDPPKSSSKCSLTFPFLDISSNKKIFLVFQILLRIFVINKKIWAFLSSSWDLKISSTDSLGGIILQNLDMTLVNVLGCILQHSGIITLVTTSLMSDNLIRNLQYLLFLSWFCIP